MALQIYNSLTREKQHFVPLKGNQVRIYVCGITVYDYCHLGHARSMACFDVIVRYLRSMGYDVYYVRNITDIDDKIIERAQQQNVDYMSIATKYIDAMHEDTDKLNILRPDREPKATEYMEQIIDLIKQLIDKDYAYVGDNGDVYYEVNKFPEYGHLSHKDLSGQEAGFRIDIVEAKRNPLDFVLWKNAKPGEPSWDSPWGGGRPGWHVECSAMAIHCLGDYFDIHGGGLDLQFPHHENEIAQSKSATGKNFANIWMHVGFLQINQQKMSKSLGNFLTIREVLGLFHPESVRYFLLLSHYRSQLNYSLENLQSAEKALERLYTCLRDIPHEDSTDLVDSEYVQRFKAAMNDDFNTPEALAVLFVICHEINRLREKDLKKASLFAAQLIKLGQLLGIFNYKPAEFLRWGLEHDEIEKVETLIVKRDQARKEKNWKEADRIRNVLKSMHVELEDDEKKTIWRKI